MSHRLSVLRTALMATVHSAGVVDLGPSTAGSYADRLVGMPNFTRSITDIVGFTS